MNNCYTSALGVRVDGSIGLNPGDLAYLANQAVEPVMDCLKERNIPKYDSIVQNGLKNDGFLLSLPSSSEIKKFYPLLCMTRSKQHDYHFIVPHIRHLSNGDISFHYSQRKNFKDIVEDFSHGSEIIRRYIDTHKYEKIYPVFAPRKYMGTSFDL